MVEAKNPAIKLFGKRIRVSPSPEGVSPPHPAADSAEEEVEVEEDYGETEQDRSEEQGISNKRKDDEQSFREEEPSSPEASPDSVNPKTPSIEEETSKLKTSKNGKDPKSKPDKILPCPRCNSSETKFCYYNNYNVSQPRHFCKSCQRYWTAGGTMRNVPVGAGRRKSKSSTRHCHVSISEALQTAARVMNSTPDGTVLSFGLNQRDFVPCTVEKRAGILNGSRSHDCLTRNFSDDHPISNLNGIGPQAHCLSSVPWPCSVPIPLYAPPPPPPAAAFWACSNVGIPSPWNFPLLPPPSLISGPNPPVLGKHPREGDVIKPDKPKKNGCILIPKTLRIDNPTEAAKSSIWATLGIKNEFGTKGGFFKGFQPKGKENEDDQTARTETEKWRVLRANPAALSRSLNFHEKNT